MSQIRINPAKSGKKDRERLLLASDIVALKRKVREMEVSLVGVMKERDRLAVLHEQDSMKIASMSDALAKVRKRTRWVRPEEGLPDFYEPVWGCIDGERIAVVYRCESDYWRYRESDSYLEEGHRVTEWARVARPAVPRRETK